MTTVTTLPNPNALPRTPMLEWKGCTMAEAIKWAETLDADTLYYLPSIRTAYAQRPRPHPASLETWSADEILKREG